MFSPSLVGVAHDSCLIYNKTYIDKLVIILYVQRKST